MKSRQKVQRADAGGKGRPTGRHFVARTPSADSANQLAPSSMGCRGSATESCENCRALRQSEARLQIAQRAGRVGIFDWDILSGRSIWNREQELIYGLAPGEFDGTHQMWETFVHPADIDRLRQRVVKLFQQRQVEDEVDFRIVRPDGQVRWISNRGATTYDGVSGKPLHMIGTTVDFTERHRADQALRESEVRLRAIVNTAADAIITVDALGIIESVNPAAERLFGYTAGSLAGLNLSALMPAPYRAGHAECVPRRMRAGKPSVLAFNREIECVRKDGSTFPAALSVSEFELGGRRMLSGIIHDISERRRLENRLLEVATAEQRRIGQELHDGLCQQLVAIGYAMEALEQRVAARSPVDAASIGQIAALVDQTMTQARDLSHGLHPVSLDASGLASSLHRLAADTESVFHVNCAFECDPTVRVKDNTVATHLYRIAQEAIGNAIRHGKASTIAVKLGWAADALRLSITDDGVGIGNSTADPDGIGMQTMAYRARALGGILTPGPGRDGIGTAVVCETPAKSSNRRKR